MKTIYKNKNGGYINFQSIKLPSNQIIMIQNQRSRDQSPERNFVEKCLSCSSYLELFWPRDVVNKLLNISTQSSDYSADSDDNLSAGAFPRLRRQKSETLRAQYVDTKELRVSVNSWNLGGEVPPEDLDITEWLDIENPADIYVIGFQEIIPLIPGNIFGSEDTRPIPIWENIIRENLNKIQPVHNKFKSYSNPPSPSRFKPSDDTPIIKDEILLESDGEGEEKISTFIDDSNFQKHERPDSLKFDYSLKDSKSFDNFLPLESYLSGDNRVVPEFRLQKVDLDSFMFRKRRPQYVRIVSKQMVGVFITIWVRRSLRKHIQNVNVSTVGVGIMGYIGNKGSISVSMSIYQTHFCFVCTHLTSGEREIDITKRNVDVEEIHKRTHFNSTSNVALPRSIKDHERIIWLGDLNYRFNLSYDETCDLIAKNDWSKLLESDQLRNGGAFAGWAEGTLNFPPTYKYEPNSDKYCGEDPKAGRRTPAWCDRILSYGKGIRQLSYKRIECRLSDHRPVSASFMIEVEALSVKRLQRALTFTDAEIETYGIVGETPVDDGMIANDAPDYRSLTIN